MKRPGDRRIRPLPAKMASEAQFYEPDLFEVNPNNFNNNLFFVLSIYSSRYARGNDGEL